MPSKISKADASVDAHVVDAEKQSGSIAANEGAETSPDSPATEHSGLGKNDDFDNLKTLDDDDSRIVRIDEIENLKSYDPFAEADDDTGEKQGAHQYLHIRIQQRNKRKTLTTVQGIPMKFDPKKILKVLRKTFACNGTIVNDPEMGQVIQLQGDQRKCVLGFLIDKDEGLALDERNIKIHGF